MSIKLRRNWRSFGLAPWANRLLASYFDPFVSAIGPRLSHGRTANRCDRCERNLFNLT
jgi:hypothetical protein